MNESETRAESLFASVGVAQAKAYVEKLEGVYEKKLADLEELKKSVLKKAFSGEL